MTVQFNPETKKFELNSNKRRLPIFGNEDSRFIVKERSFPESTVGAIGTNDRASCTGFLVGSKYVATALHCLRDSSTGNYISNQYFYPNLVDGTSFDKVRIRSWIWAGNKDGFAVSADDWALIILDEDIGEKYGWIGMTLPYAYSSNLHNSVYNLGYSADLSRESPSSSGSCSIVSTVGNNVYHSCDTSGGDSGSPIFIERFMHSPVAVAIHNGREAYQTYHFAASIRRVLCNYNAIIAGTTTCTFEASDEYDPGLVPSCSKHSDCLTDDTYCNDSNICFSCFYCQFGNDAIDGNCCETNSPTNSPTKSIANGNLNSSFFQDNKPYILTGAGVVTLISGYILYKSCCRSNANASRNTRENNQRINFPVDLESGN